MSNNEELLDAELVLLYGLEVLLFGLGGVYKKKTVVLAVPKWTPVYVDTNWCDFFFFF